MTSKPGRPKVGDEILSLTLTPELSEAVRNAAEPIGASRASVGRFLLEMGVEMMSEETQERIKQGDRRYAEHGPLALERAFQQSYEHLGLLARMRLLQLPRIDDTAGLLLLRGDVEQTRPKLEAIVSGLERLGVFVRSGNGEQDVEAGQVLIVDVAEHGVEALDTAVRLSRSLQYGVIGVIPSGTSPSPIQRDSAATFFDFERGWIHGSWG